MNCPSCPSTNLQMTERSGVEIDYCPSCRGIWLDRGELDKILERSTASEFSPSQGTYHNPPQHKYKEKYRHKKSWLHEIFD